MATKTFTKENAGEYVPQAKDEFEWCGDTFVCGHNSVGAYQFAVLPYAIRSLTNEQWRDLLNAGLITIHREVPEEPFVIEEAHIGTSRVSGFTYGRCLRLDNIPEDRFEHGEVVKVTIEKVKP